MTLKNSPETILEEVDAYEIKSGDTLFAIAKTLGVPLSRIISLNRTINPNRLSIGQKIRIPKIEKKEYEEKLIDFSQIQKDQDRLNILPFDQMIHGYHIRHSIDEPYVVEDKKAHTMSVYKKGKLIFSCKTNTGLSGEDYMTKTFATGGGKLVDNAGNMSTPAGIFSISGVGSYHGVPSFTRANKNGDTPSSIHTASIIDSKNPNRSNGCTRVASKDLEKLALYIQKGTRVFILPEKEGSKFFVRNGEINFTAESPYGGIDENGKKGMKDYTTYAPLVTKPIVIDSPNFKRRRDIVLGGGADEFTNSTEPTRISEETLYGKFVATIESSKEALQKDLGINNDTYNDIAKLACSIALQESKFGESKRYKFKQVLGDAGQDFFQKGRKYARREWGSSGAVLSGFGGVLGYFSETDTEANSKGIAQVKIDGIFKGKNEVVKTLFHKYGIDRDTIEGGEKSGLAIMILLGSMYIHEVPQIRGNLKSLGLSDIDALIYMNQGKKYELTRGTATPDKNQYLQKIRTGMKDFQILQKEKVLKSGA